MKNDDWSYGGVIPKSGINVVFHHSVALYQSPEIGSTFS